MHSRRSLQPRLQGLLANLVQRGGQKKECRPSTFHSDKMLFYLLADLPSLRHLGILPLHKARRLGVPSCGHQHCHPLLGYADSTSASAQQSSSQQGSLALLTTPHCSEVNAKANLIDRCSNRWQGSPIDFAPPKLLAGDRPQRDLSSWRLNQKSLFDAVAAERPKTTDTRTYVDTRSIQELIKDNCADGVCRQASKLLRGQLRGWLDKLRAQLTAPGGSREESPFREGREVG